MLFDTLVADTSVRSGITGDVHRISTDAVDHRGDHNLGSAGLQDECAVRGFPEGVQRAQQPHPTTAA